MSAPRYLKRIRETRHFELDAVAKYAGISADRLQEFEAGAREPSFKQLQRLADAYNLPSYLLAVDAPPNLPETITDFRRTVPRPAQLSPDGMQKVWAAEQTSHFTAQLVSATEFEKPDWFDYVPKGQPTPKLARALRRYFDEWLSERRGNLGFVGSADQVFFSAFRLFTEVQGNVVRVNEAPSSDYLGFFLQPDDGVPTVFVNRKTSARKAQLFTLLHEYAHALLGLAGISDPFHSKNAVERGCNMFAAEFLAPSDTFTALVERQTRAARQDVFRFIDAVSSQSLLSKHATAIRLVETGYLSRLQLAPWLRARSLLSSKDLKQEESDATGESFGQPHAKRIGEIGYLPTYLASIAVKSQIIDAADVAAGISLSQTLQERAFSLASRRIEAAAR